MSLYKPGKNGATRPSLQHDQAKHFKPVHRAHLYV